MKVKLWLVLRRKMRWEHQLELFMLARDPVTCKGVAPLTLAHLQSPVIEIDYRQPPAGMAEVL